MLEWGPFLKLLERRARKGRSVPALEKRPEIFEDLSPAWKAFNELHKSRQIGFVPEPLTVTDISHWLDLYDYRNEERREMYELIKILDDCWLFHMRKKVEKKEKERKSKEKGRRKRK